VRMDLINVVRVDKSSELWHSLTEYAENCSWIAGKHLAELLRGENFTEWESVFAALADETIVGFCTFLKTDYYPENRYSPWISSIFVDEAYRGNRISQKMIETAIEYARSCQFKRVYIPSDMIGFYEKFGFSKIGELRNYDGDLDNIYYRDI